MLFHALIHPPHKMGTIFGHLPRRTRCVPGEGLKGALDAREKCPRVLRKMQSARNTCSAGIDVVQKQWQTRRERTRAGGCTRPSTPPVGCAWFIYPRLEITFADNSGISVESREFGLSVFAAFYRRVRPIGRSFDILQRRLLNPDPVFCLITHVILRRLLIRTAVIIGRKIPLLTFWSLRYRS